MTSAVRDADNGDAFRATVAERFGLEGRTLTGDEEARFTFGGATAARPADDPTDARGDRHRRRLHGARLRRRARAGLPRLDPDRRRPPLASAHLPHDPPPAGELDALAAEATRGIEAAVPADVRASARRGDRGRRHRHLVRRDRPRARALRRRAGRGPRAVARHARRPARPARGTAARASAATSAACTPTARRRSSPGVVILIERARPPSVSERSRSLTATSSGAWPSIWPANPDSSTDCRKLDVRTMALPLTPAGYSQCRSGRSCLPPSSPDA